MIFSIRDKFNGKAWQYSIDDNFCKFQKLTPECELFGETGNSYGYINTVGKRVWVPKSRCKKVEVV